jgi:hypothetical protein
VNSPLEPNSPRRAISPNSPQSNHQIVEEQEFDGQTIKKL